jgi:hypothetical protein
VAGSVGGAALPPGPSGGYANASLGRRWAGVRRMANAGDVGSVPGGPGRGPFFPPGRVPVPLSGGLAQPMYG